MNCDDLNLNTLFMKINIDFIYPIGTIYETTSTVHPNVLFGGTWEEYGRGRVTVGLYPTWSETSYIGQIGGEKEHTLTVKEMPSHIHSLEDSFVDGVDVSRRIALSGIWGTKSGYGAGGYEGATGGDEAHNNMQPYIVVYRYRRIA